MRKKHGYLVVVAVCALTSVGALGQSSWFSSDTPGSRFRKHMNELQRDCDRGAASRRPGDTSCDILKLEPRQWDKQSFIKVEGQPLPVPASWVSTEEGRYAHSIKVPNPLPADSGYKKGMKSEEYFKRLCEKEAGEFVYKKMSNVVGLTQLRLIDPASHLQRQHLYALEDPSSIALADREANFWQGLVFPGGYQAVSTKSRGLLIDLMQPHLSQLGGAKNVVQKSEWIVVEGRTEKGKFNLTQQINNAAISEYGYLWRGIVRPMDRELGIAGGELIVLNRNTSEVMGVFRYFVQGLVNDTLIGVSWLSTCPQFESGKGPSRSIKRRAELLFQVLEPIR